MNKNYLLKFSSNQYLIDTQVEFATAVPIAIYKVFLKMLEEKKQSAAVLALKNIISLKSANPYVAREYSYFKNKNGEMNWVPSEISNLEHTSLSAYALYGVRLKIEKTVISTAFKTQEEAAKEQEGIKVFQAHLAEIEALNKELQNIKKVFSTTELKTPLSIKLRAMRYYDKRSHELGLNLTTETMLNWVESTFLYYEKTMKEHYGLERDDHVVLIKQKNSLEDIGTENKSFVLCANYDGQSGFIGNTKYYELTQNLIEAKIFSSMLDTQKTLEYYRSMGFHEIIPVEVELKFNFKEILQQNPTEKNEAFTQLKTLAEKKILLDTINKPDKLDTIGPDNLQPSLKSTSIKKSHKI